MNQIRVVWGGADGPTAMAAYDAALADANVHDYNLVTVSSVVPAEAGIEAVGTAPDLGPTGNRLTVVQSRETVPPGADGPAVSGIGWARGPDGEGIFYEASGDGREGVRERIERGLSHGIDLRAWTAVDEGAVVRETSAAEDAYTVQVVCAIYGESTPIC